MYLKTLFLKYKSVIKFILLFLGTYLVLIFLYSLYLDYGKSEVYYPDFITHLVAKQTTAVIESFGYNASMHAFVPGASMGLYIDDFFLAQVVEGCNAVSVIILFVAFVVSFSEKFKKTALFIFAGIALTYAVNILRVALLTIALYHYPEHTDFLHQIVFPAIIYGMVFLLWLFWVKNVTVKKRNNE